MAPATDRGTWWEWRNSLWILWSVPLLACISFAWIGARGRNPRWAAYAIGYGLAVLGPVAASDAVPDRDGFDAYDAMLLTFLAAWVGSIVHATHARRAYLSRRDAVLRRGTWGSSTVPEPVGRSRHPTTREAVASAVSSLSASPQSAHGEPVDPNSATFAELRALPGLGSVAAQRVIEHRTERGPLESFEEFVSVVALQPHVAARLRPLVRVAPSTDAHQRDDEPPTSRGRILDL